MIFLVRQVKAMNTDNLTERIAVVYFETTRNDKGDIVKGAEVTRCTVWANVKPLKGKVEESQPKRDNSLSYRITIRYRTDILPDDNIVWRGRRLKITIPPFDVESKHRYTQLTAEEVIQDGQSKP